MLSEFQQRKLSYMFDLYDADKNGFLEESDFAQVGQRFDQAVNLAHDEASNWFMGFWQGLAPAADAEGRVSRAAWLTLLDALWGNPAAFAATIEAGASFYMNALDTDHDGRLSPAEGRLFFRVLNLDESVADEVWAHLDTNQDGYITPDEYNQRVREFYGDDPDAPGNWLLGPVPTRG